MIQLNRTPHDLKDLPNIIAKRGGELGKPLFLLDETTSTNDEAKSAAREGAPSGAVWLAETQTAGRGRQGRTWCAARGESLLFSVLVRIACPPARLPPLSLVAGLAVRDAIAQSLPHANVGLKWPNDVLVEDKKIAGVLVEAILRGMNVEALVIGVGINVHSRDFPTEIADRATSLALESTRSRKGESTPPERAEILADTLAGLDRDLFLAASRGLGFVHSRLCRHDVLRGSRVRSETGEGTADGIDIDGRLIVRNDDGIRTRWSVGEVHLIR